jgi:hypothetical protein
MELIAKISKGSKMDQIYIPKNRSGCSIGQYVLIKPIQETEKQQLFYHVKKIEPIKNKIVEELFSFLQENIENPDNIILTGSFLEKGFVFQDVDIIILTNDRIDNKMLEKTTEERFGLKMHILSMKKEEFYKGVSTNPLFCSMLSNFISLKRINMNIPQILIREILDLNILKTKDLILNFEILSGREKYYLLRNLVATKLFIEKKKITKENMDILIKKIIGTEIEKLKENLIKEDVVTDIEKEYNSLLNKILKIENAK